MKGARILIVEDDPVIVEVIAQRLEHDGYETEVMHLVERLSRQSPGVILTS